MEIFKVGDEISIAGYKSITLAADMQTNIENFAQVNSIELTEAEKILNSHPAIQNFIANLSSKDEEDNYEITGDFTNDSAGNKTATVNSNLSSDSEVTLAGTKTITNNKQKNIDLDALTDLMQPGTDNMFAGKKTSTYSQSELDIIQAEIENLESQIISKANEAYLTENEFEQYTIEQEINTILDELKSKTIEYNSMLAVNEGQYYLSNAEIRLIDRQCDISFKKLRLTAKQSYLESKLISLNYEQATAMKNNDQYSQYVLEQQKNSILELSEIFKRDSVGVAREEARINNASSILQKYPNNTAIQNIVSQQLELYAQLTDIYAQLQSAMQKEDEYAQYELEQSENGIYKQLQSLELNLQQEIANEEGKVLSSIEIYLIESKYEQNIRQIRIEEKQAYLVYKQINIDSQIKSAIIADDEYSLYILEQQDNAINALRSTFNIDALYLNKFVQVSDNLLNILQKYPNNTKLQNIVSQQISKYENLLDIYSKKSTAMQNDDEQAQSVLEQQESDIQNQLKTLEVNLQKEIAKAEGKTLSSSDITKIEEEFDLNVFKDKVREKEIFVQYRLIETASNKSTAMLNEDEYAQYVLEQQENDLHTLYTQLQALEDVTDVQVGYALLDAILKSASSTQTDETTEVESAEGTTEATAVEEATETNGVTPAQEVSDAKEVQDSEPTSPSSFPDANPSSPKSNNTIRDLFGMFGISIDSDLEDVTYDTNYNNRIKSFVLDGKSYQLVYDGNKLVGYKHDGKTYSAVFDKDGAVKEIQTKDENGKVISRKAFPANPLEQYYIDVEVAEEALLEEIMPYLRLMKNNFSDYDEQQIRDILKTCVNDYKEKKPIGGFYSYFLRLLSDRLGYNIKSLKDTIDTGSSIGQQILKKFTDLLSVVDSGLELIEEEKKWTTEYVTVDGVKFKIRYLKSVGTNPCTISLTGGKILISGHNCTVDVLGLGNYSDDIQINGEDIVVNCNATTFGKITNSAKNSTINGSFGNDDIENTSQAVGTTINAGFGDDMITNRANDAKLNGQSGNDTFINYANATIDGGDGDDVVKKADNVRTTILDSAGDDKTYTFHVDEPEEPSNPSDDPEYPYCKDFTICGVTFTVYAKINDFSGVSYSSYKHLVTINASNVKIKIKSKTYDDTRIRLEGDTLNFDSNVTLASVFNYADHSTINGTGGDDALFNYADDVTVNGLDGKDRLINEGSQVTLDGGSKEDHIYNRQQDGTVTINADSSDKVYNEGNGSSRITISQGSMSEKEYNFTVTWSYIENTLNNSNFTIDSTISQSVYNNIQSLLSTLITTTNGQKEYSETALKLIDYARNKSTDNVSKTNFELLKIALTEADTTSDGNITTEELTAMIIKATPTNRETQWTSTNNILGYNLPSLKDATITSLSASLKATVGLTDAQMSAFINAQSSSAEALKVLKQIQTIINMCSSSSVSLLDNIKSMMTDDTFDFNNEILEDAQMVVEALESDDYNTYIKNQMILNASNLTDAQILSQTSFGDVVEKADGKLYVNNGGSLSQLNISADTYLTLFPPIGRYFVEQNDYEDCFFMATTLIEGMENGASRAVLLKMFSEDESGNITVKFPNIDYPVTFYGGQLKATDGKWTQVSNGETYSLDWNEYGRETTPATTLSTGLSMLEQAYALAKFAELSNANIDYETISTYYSSPLAAAVDDAVITDTSSLDMDKALLFYYKGGYDDNVYEDLYGNTSNEHQSFTNCTTTAQKESILLAAYNNSLNSKGVMTTRILGSVSNEDVIKYNLGGGHQYAIEKIDTVNKMVYVKNPWEGYMVIALPYDKFFEYFSDILYRTI